MSTSPPEFEARQLSLPKPLYTQTPQISSFLYDSISSSLAIRHTDSSLSLYTSFSPLSQPAFPPPKSLVPAPTSASTFLNLRTASTSNPARTVFVTSSPLLRPVPSTLLCFFILRDDRFGKIKVVSKHRDLEFDKNRNGVVLKVNHGLSIKLYGGVNVFALHSISNSKIWVFAVRLISDECGGEALKLMKCAVIDCCLPVFTVGVLFRCLILGEENGVRVFSLQVLVKGNHNKAKKSGGKHSDSAKLRTMKLRQDSRNVGSFFVAFEDKDVAHSITMKTTKKRVKAVSVQAVSTSHFLVLDSVGDVHLLCLSRSGQLLDNPFLMKRLTQTMKVLKLAVFHDVSSATQKIWVSDGCHSVHLLMVSGMDVSSEETENTETMEKQIQTSVVTHAIFVSEKIQDMLPSDANGILILGQGSLFAYSTSVS